MRQIQAGILTLLLGAGAVEARAVPSVSPEVLPAVTPDPLPPTAMPAKPDNGAPVPATAQPDKGAPAPTAAQPAHPVAPPAVGAGMCTISSNCPPRGSCLHQLLAFCTFCTKDHGCHGRGCDCCYRGFVPLYLYMAHPCIEGSGCHPTEPPCHCHGHDHGGCASPTGCVGCAGGSH